MFLYKDMCKKQSAASRSTFFEIISVLFRLRGCGVDQFNHDDDNAEMIFALWTGRCYRTIAGRDRMRNDKIGDYGAHRGGHGLDGNIGKGY